MRDNLELVARPEEVLQTRMDNGLDWRTDRASDEIPPEDQPQLANPPRLKPGPKRRPVDRLFNGIIYFIHASGTDFIKIGYTCDVKDRLKKLQTASPHELVVLASRKATFLDEQRLHSRFAEHRVRGEWFRRAPEIDAEIERINDPFGHIERN